LRSSVVDSVAAANSEPHAGDTVHVPFFQDPASLPPADPIVVNDMLQPLPDRVVRDDLDHSMTKDRRQIVTNRDHLPQSRRNQAIDALAWGPLPLELPPFEGDGSPLVQRLVLTPVSMRLQRKRTDLGRVRIGGGSGSGKVARSPAITHQFPTLLRAV
jgi:hypothetical protein